MVLKEVLYGLEYRLLRGNPEVNTTKICYNSRKVDDGSLFVAIRGYRVDGHRFIPSAISKGAKVIVVEGAPKEMVEGITYIQIENTRHALSKISANFYRNPSNKLKIIGITGTNGKTSTSIILSNILRDAGKKVGIIGTIGCFIGDIRKETDHTTPESLELQQILVDMLKGGMEYVIMEVSSHALKLDRVSNINFYKTIFTNLTQDHLDFHGDLTSYYNEKRKLFFMNESNAFVNGDDEFGMKLASELKSSGREVCTFGTNANNNLYASGITFDIDGVEFTLHTDGLQGNIYCQIPGLFSVYNVLSASSVALSEGILLSDIQKSVKNTPVISGRMEKLDYNTPFDILIDFAHTPDGLENVLTTLRHSVVGGRIITIFGCGGDRDKGKRAIMGEIAGNYSDLCIVTSDNPRSEEPRAIIEDIIKGVKKTDCDYIAIENRREAIKYGLEIADSSDVLLLAGKGHETHQIIGDKTIPFDERVIVMELLEDADN